jgi:hypothetical protein
MKETIWIYLAREYEKQLEDWRSYNAYYTENSDWGELVAFRFITSEIGYKTFTGYLNQNNIEHFVFRREYSFTKSEKAKAEILELIVDGVADNSDSPESFYYDCKVCGRKVKKLSRGSVHANYKYIKKYDLTESYAPNGAEIFVSERLREVFIKEDITGASFQPVYDIRTNKQIEGFYNIILREGIGEIIPPSIVDIGNKCQGCGLYDKFSVKGLLYFSRKTWDGLDICYTSNWLGYSYKRKDSYNPESKSIIISQRLYRILNTYKIKLFSVRPAFFVD